MKAIHIDFNKTCGAVKPMHAVNNGPVYKFAEDQRITNMEAWKDAGIPYARTHDAVLYNTYGGPHTIDVNCIFTDFDADPYSPESYDFICTDEYLKVIDFSGTKIFYRLGASIEHWPKKYHTLPPKDFQKWAVICEHIIRHYTEGWADGFHYNIEYWEIWNEPDLDPDDSANKRTWGGTKAQFFDFFEVAAKHLKSTFPHLKIGGPALAGNMDWGRDFLLEMHNRNVPLDFLSWHCYAYEPNYVAKRAQTARRIMDETGYADAESINNEWNYVKGWSGDDWIYSLKAEKSLKGASYIIGTMCACQYAPLDLLMYYDARPCGMNGMFNSDYVCDLLKGYYPFKMFNELYKLDNCAEVTCDDHMYACAAASENKAAFIFTHFCDNDSTSAEDVKINCEGFASEQGVKATYYLLSEDKDLEFVREEVFTGDAYTTLLHAGLFHSYLVVLEKGAF